MPPPRPPRPACRARVVRASPSRVVGHPSSATGVVTVIIPIYRSVIGFFSAGRAARLLGQRLPELAVLEPQSPPRAARPQPGPDLLLGVEQGPVARARAGGQVCRSAVLDNP